MPGVAHRDNTHRELPGRSLPTTVGTMSELPYDRFANWDGKCPECECAVFVEDWRAAGTVGLSCSQCGTALTQVDMLALGGRKQACRVKGEGWPRKAGNGGD